MKTISSHLKSRQATQGSGRLHFQPPFGKGARPLPPEVFSGRIAPEAWKECSCQCYSASDIARKADRPVDRPTYSHSAFNVCLRFSFMPVWTRLAYILWWGITTNTLNVNTLCSPRSNHPCIIVNVGTHEGTSPCNRLQGHVTSCEVASFCFKTTWMGTRFGS